jgi:outer membrane protein OmpA-like peptidoglycan-associated protein
MTVPTMRPDHHRPIASWLVSGALAVALLMPSDTVRAAGDVSVDLGALDALPPPATTGAPAIHLRPPDNAKSAPTARPAPAAKPTAKPTAKTTLHMVPAPAAAPDATTAEPPAPVQRQATTAPTVAPPPVAPPVTSPAVASPTVASPALAALPPAPATAPAASIEPTGRLMFAGGSFDLSSDAKSELDAVAARLTADPHLYLQLMAYAAGGGDGSEARRLSLSRALAARGYLLDHGVDGKQVDVRPLGNRSEPGQPPDRVDCVVATR